MLALSTMGRHHGLDRQALLGDGHLAVILNPPGQGLNDAAQLLARDHRHAMAASENHTPCLVNATVDEGRSGGGCVVSVVRTEKGSADGGASRTLLCSEPRAADHQGWV